MTSTLLVAALVGPLTVSMVIGRWHLHRLRTSSDDSINTVLVAITVTLTELRAQLDSIAETQQELLTRLGQKDTD